jgi:hypothetical protein
MEYEIGTKESKMKGNQNIMTSGQRQGGKGKCAHEFDRHDLTGRSPSPRLGYIGAKGTYGKWLKSQERGVEGRIQNDSVLISTRHQYHPV